MTRVRRSRPERPGLARTLVVLAVIGGATASAQSTYPAELLRDLPTGGNLFAILESAQPEITTDRFNGGGLNGGDPDKVSGFLASWSQTQYRLGDIAISSPVDGTPMLFPELTWWNRVEVATGLMPEDTTATGVAIALEPVAAGARWTRTVEFTASGGGLAQHTPAGRPDAIGRLDDWTQGMALGSGRSMNGRLGLVLGGAWTRASTTTRNRAPNRSHTRSVFASATFALAGNRSIHGLVWRQANAVHSQATLKHQDKWRVFAGFTGRAAAMRSGSAGRLAIDRLTDGPIPLSIDRGGDERRWTAGARWSVLSSPRSSLVLGGDFERTAYAAEPSFAGVVEERVDNVPARLWHFVNGEGASRRHATLVNVSAANRISLGRGVSADLGLRFESADAHANGAAGGIAWRTWLPSSYFHFDVGTPMRLRLLTGVSRAADQPMLTLLAYGDPAAPTARVFRWDGGAVSGAPVMARVGPGTGGDPAFSSIDPALKRPITDQFALGVESRPTPTLRLNVLGLARRQSSLTNVVNIGVPSSGYTMFTIPDANADWVGPSDDQQLPVYNRKPETFGQDRYLLTNPDVERATMGAVVVSADLVTSRVLFRIGGTASASVGSGGHRGFTANENDHSLTGELFTNPNASTYARGRLFNDRAYTIKTLATVRLPSSLRLGLVARFQDGQPFSRLAVVTGLNQGAEAIQTFANGRSRFSYRSTLDARLQKRVHAGPAALDVMVDAYNLLNMATEVEEYVVTGPRFRETTAVQPPRTFHIGARLTF